MRLAPLLIVLLVSSFCASGQQYSFLHYKAENGLSYNSVMCVLQDRQGFMWFATRDGLNRYDGYRFKVFRNIPGDSQSIGSNTVHKLLIDHNGTLLAGTTRGLYQYNSNKESFSLVPGTASGSIQGLQKDDAGNTWYLMNNRLFVTTHDYKSSRQVDLQQTVAATALARTGNNKIWIGFSNGSIASIDANSQRASYYHPAVQTGLLREQVECLVPIDENSLLIGTGSQGLYEYNPATNTSRLLLSTDKAGNKLFVRDGIKAGPHEYWIATELGIFIVDIQSGHSVQLSKRFGDPYSLNDNAVYTIFQDKEGGIWAGTYFGGINYMPRQFNRFEKFYPNGQPGLSGNAVREIVEDKYGRLWIGTEDAGLNMLDKATGRIRHFKADQLPGSIAYNNVHGLLADDDKLYVGYFQHGLDVIDLTTLRVVRHFSQGSAPGSLRHNFIHSIIKLKNGNLLMATAAGVQAYNPNTNELKTVEGFPLNTFYTAIKEDRDGMLWAGSFSEGLYYYHPQTNMKGALRYDARKKNSLPSDRVNIIYEDHAGSIWVATENGLVKLNTTDYTADKIYNTANGMPGNIIYNLLEDGQHHFWVSTSKGLVELNPEKNVLRTFTSSSGLLSDQFNYNSAFKDAAGRMYFGSVGGLIRFHPAALLPDSTIPPVVLTGIQVNNEELEVKRNGSSSPLTSSITALNKLTLQHNQNNISFDFAALRYANPNLVQYAYRLKGLDDKWTYLERNRKVYYTDLQPGTYEFMVKAANEKGEWQQQSTNLTIKIRAPFWKSNLAMLLYSLMLAAIAYIIYRYSRKYREEKNKVLKEQLEHERDREIYRSKIDFFTNIAHEIRTPLTLIKLPLEKILGTADTPAIIKEKLLVMGKNADRLIQLTNQLLDFRKTETEHYSLSYVKTNINSMLQDVYERFKPAAIEKGKNMGLQLPRIALHAFVDPEALTKILSNLVDNAVKYADDSIEIKLLPFNSEDEQFTILVINDHLIEDEATRIKIFEPFYRINQQGKEGGTGIGLALAKTLTDLHNGSLALTASADEKNVFTLKLPILQEEPIGFETEKPDDQQNLATTYADPDNHDKPALLLVDDNQEILSFVAKELAEKYSIYLARNGEEGLSMLAGKPIQLVVSDIMMPGLDGYEFCRRIKSDIRFSHIPVILLTAKNSIQSKIEGLESGAEAYIEKPFSLPYLDAQIHSLFVNRDKTKQFFNKSPLVHMRTMAHTRADEEFLEALQQGILDNIDDVDLDIEKLAQQLNMSRSTLFRKIKDISNLTPNELINIIRLKRAAELLQTKDLKVYEVSGMVGYKHPSNFSRDFSRQFGKSPADFLKTLDAVEEK